MRRLAGLAVLLAALLLAGCSAIPIGGPVQTAPPQNAAPQNAPLLTPPRPTAGALPADVVKGFLNAATGQQDDYAIARLYLTTKFRQSWNPNAGVTVSQGHVKVADDGSSASVPEAATLDSHGVFRLAPAGTVDTRPFTLQKVDGEWRIASAPDGIVLAYDLFTLLFRAVPLDYFTPDTTELVPDLRWFPARRDEADLVVRRLLGGPQGPVASPVTATAFPGGTTLTRVVLTGGTATVDLAVPSATPSVAALGRMRRQLESSLAVLGIQRVRLEIGGEPQTVTDAPISSSPNPGAGAPLVLQGSTFGYLSGSKLAPYAMLGSVIAKAKPVAVTASEGQSRAAILTARGDVQVLAPTGKPVTVDSRVPLSAPTLDPQGWTWSVPVSDPSGLQAARNGKTVHVPVAVAADTVTAIEMSRDGTRLLLVLDGDADPSVLVVGVERAADGTPTALTAAAYEAQPTDPEVIDATWADSGSIALLTRHKDGSEGVVLQQLGGLTSTDGTVSHATSIVGGGAASDLAVLEGNDVLQTSNGTTIWQSKATGVTLLATAR